MESLNINWYPGHMAKAKRMISENMKLVDAVCEIVDARIPFSSRNPVLYEEIEKKPILIILNRADQADPSATKNWVSHFKVNGEAVLETDSKSGMGVGAFPAAVRSLLKDTISRNEAKGQIGKGIRVMVVGIPNVGKSSFINRAARRKAAATSDRPGVTRGKQWINISRGLELLDTHGVLWPKFDDQTIAENLAFTGAIRDDIMDIEALGANLMARLKTFYPKCLAERYKLSLEADLVPDATGYDLLKSAAVKRGFRISGGELDLERIAITLLDEFRGGKLGRITLENSEFGIRNDFFACCQFRCSFPVHPR
jgi:ribosome biogenesis GTPase A